MSKHSSTWETLALNFLFPPLAFVAKKELLSIPFFTSMGAVLERCGLAEDLLDSIGQLFGPMRGGMSYAVIFVGAILGANTGTVAASVIVTLKGAVQPLASLTVTL